MKVRACGSSQVVEIDVSAMVDKAVAEMAPDVERDGRRSPTLKAACTCGRSVNIEIRSGEFADIGISDPFVAALILGQSRPVTEPFRSHAQPAACFTQ